MRRTVHLIRHGQSTYNAACAASPWAPPLIYDAPLSPRGENEVTALREQVAELGAELVVTSPLTRAIQTALGAFGGGPAPILVNALVRECVEACGDVGRSPKLLAAEFPMLRFDHLDDPWWYTTSDDPLAVCMEPEATLRARIESFLAWIPTQPFSTLAVIGHGTFFNHLTGTRLDNCGRITITV